MRYQYNNILHQSKWFRMRHILQLIWLFLMPPLLFCVSSCAPSYTSPTTNHSYITNTQEAHELTGLRVIHERESALFNPFSRAFSALGSEQTAVYIDGRKVSSYIWDKDHNTLIQLPPGHHELVLKIVGGNSGLETYDLFLEEGEIKTLRTYKSIHTFYIPKDQINKLAQSTSKQKSNNDLKLLETKNKLGLISEDEYLQKKEEKTDSETLSNSSSGLDTLEERLSVLKRLFDNGIITREEYDRKREKILNEL